MRIVRHLNFVEQEAFYLSLLVTVALRVEKNYLFPKFVPGVQPGTFLLPPRPLLLMLLPCGV